MKQEMMRWQWHQLDHLQIIAVCSRRMTTPESHHSIFYEPDVLPAANQQCQSTEGKIL